MAFYVFVLIIYFYLNILTSPICIKCIKVKTNVRTFFNMLAF